MEERAELKVAEPVKEILPATGKALPEPVKEPTKDLTEKPIEVAEEPVEPFDFKEPKKGQLKGARKLHGAVKKAGFISSIDKVTGKPIGEYAAYPEHIKKQLFRKNGKVDFWDADEFLKSEGFLSDDESFYDLAHWEKNKGDLSGRSRLNVDLSEIQERELTQQQRDFLESQEYSPVAPEGLAEGKYKQINAEDLPEGKKLKIIDSKGIS